MTVGKAQTIGSVFWKLFEKGGSQVVSLFVQIILARLLSPDDYGALAIMVVFVNIANVFVQSGFATSIIQAEEIDDEALSSALWITLIVSIALYLLVWAISPFVADFYGIEKLKDALRVLMLTIPIGAYTSLLTGIASREMQFKKFFYATIVSVLLSGGTGICLAVFGAGLWALVAQQVVFGVANCAALFLQIKWTPKAVFSTQKARRLFSFGWKLLVSGILETGYQSLSDLLIGKQFSASSLGLVSQGKKIPMTLGNVLDGAIQPVMLAAVARAQNDKQYVKRLVRRALKTSTFLIVPSMTFFAISAEPVVLCIFGEQWLPCVPFFQIYCIVYMLLPIHTTNLQALNGMGRSDLFLRLELIKKAYGISCILFAAFVLRDVYLMVAMYVITGVISTFVNAYPNKRVIGYSYGEQLRDIAPAFLLSAISGCMAWCVILLGLPSIGTIALQLIVMVAVYLGLARLLQVEELEYLLATAGEMLGRKGGKREE